MRARYPDHCPLCGGDIEPGQDVVPHGDGWCHRSCAPGSDE